MGPNQTYNFFITKEIIKLKRKPTKQEKNLCKKSDRKGINLQNTQVSQSALYPKKKPI